MRDVLVVEDDRVVLSAVGRLCRVEGLEVDEIETVDGALELLARSAYRLVLVDLMLPGPSGLELLEALGGDRPAPPAIVISDYATSENALRSFRRGAFDFLPKPFDVPELLGVLRRGLRYGERRSRGVELPAGGERRYFLGRHSWAELDGDGTATIGAAETFSGVLAELDRVELPSGGEHVAQGQRLVRIEGAEEAHRVRSPLSGLIVAVNSELGAAASRIGDDPFGSGWLARIVPADLESELQALTHRRAGEEPAAVGG